MATRFIFTVFLIIYTIKIAAQSIPEAAPQTFFVKKSVSIGEPVEMVITYLHPFDQTILFPDSTYDFTPFEFIEKRYFPTKTIGNVSRDCTIYLLRTFKVQKELLVSLPVFILSQNDTTRIFSTPTSIRLNEVVTEIPEFPELKKQVSFSKVPTQVNYPYIILIVVSGLLFLFAVKVIFGKPIKKRYKIVSAILAHRKFSKLFEQTEKEYLAGKEVVLLEKLLGLWKDYLTGLEEKPIATYTSTEIISLYGKEDLKNSLQVIDKAIFGRILSQEEDKALKNLKNFSNKRYIIRKNEIRNS